MKEGDAFETFLAKEDFPEPCQYIIESVVKEAIGQKQEVKPVMSFKETSRRIVVNKKNWKSCVEITRETDSDNWPGHKIELFADPTIEFGGKKVGGVRIRKPGSE